MNRIYGFALACLASLTLLAPIAIADEPGHGFSALYVFGDSLSDTGNSHADTGRTAHPPFEPIPNDSYGIGGHHYSNGKTWVENLAKDMDLINGARPAMHNPMFGNYAYGGARARDYLVDNKPDLSAQVRSFLAAHNQEAPADALYIVQIGGNDLRDAITAVLMGQSPMPIFVDAINSIGDNIGLLMGLGAQHFLIVNAPNLGVTPLVPGDLRDAVTSLSYLFNMYLSDALVPLPQYGVNVYNLNLFEFTSMVGMSPEAFGFASLDSCLTFLRI